MTGQLGQRGKPARQAQGPAGNAGPTGAPGDIGPTGPTGPGGIVSAAYIASTQLQAIAPPASPRTAGGVVSFDYTYLYGTAITFTAPSSININEPGVYSISWGVFPAGQVACALFFEPTTGVGGPVMVSASNYASLVSCTYQGQVITQFTSSGVLTLNRINNDDDFPVPVNLMNKSEGFGGTPVISASIVIQKLG